MGMEKGGEKGENGIGKCTGKKEGKERGEEVRGGEGDGRGPLASDARSTI